MGRMEKVNQQVKREVGCIIQQELSDPRLEFVTILAATVSPDLRTAIINYSVLNTAKRDEAQKALNSAAGAIHRILGGRLDMRNIPHLTFVYDSSIEDSFKMDQVLKELDQRVTENDNSDD